MTGILRCIYRSGRWILLNQNHPHLRSKVASAAWTANLKCTRSSEPQAQSVLQPWRKKTPWRLTEISLVDIKTHEWNIHHTLKKTKMTLGKCPCVHPCSIGHTTSNGGFSVVMFVFEGYTSMRQWLEKKQVWSWVWIVKLWWGSSV